MIIMPQLIQIQWGSRNKNYFESKNYKYTKMKDEFWVDISDLQLNSQNRIKCKCDYCGQEFEAYYCNAIKPIKHACKDCKGLKLKEYFKEKYGVTSALQINEFKEKNKQTCLEKYGVENVYQADQVKNKIKQNNLQKYGVDNYSKTDDYKIKYKQTCLNKYGVDNYSKTNQFKEEIIPKAFKTMYENSNAPCSKQQKHINELLGGELNYAIDTCWLDIAFPNEMLYIEYDGGGHNLSVKLGNLSQEEFKKKEMKRQYYLKSLGWKLIRIICNNDKLPIDKEIIKKINEAKEYLNKTQHSWVTINF